MGGDSEVLKDEYNFEQDTEHLKRDLFADDDEDDVNGDSGSRREDQGSNFLKVYDKSKGSTTAGEETEENSIKNGQVKYKQDEDKKDPSLSGQGD